MSLVDAVPSSGDGATPATPAPSSMTLFSQTGLCFGYCRVYSALSGQYVGRRTAHSAQRNHVAGILRTLSQGGKASLNAIIIIHKTEPEVKSVSIIAPLGGLMPAALSGRIASSLVMMLFFFFFSYVIALMLLEPCKY